MAVMTWLAGIVGPLESNGRNSGGTGYKRQYRARQRQPRVSVLLAYGADSSGRGGRTSVDEMVSDSFVVATGSIAH